MCAVAFTETGGPEVFQPLDVPDPVLRLGQVRIPVCRPTQGKLALRHTH